MLYIRLSTKNRYLSVFDSEIHILKSNINEMRIPKYIYFLIIYISLTANLLAQSNLTPTAKKLKSQIEMILAHDLNADTSKRAGFVVGMIDGDSTWTFGFGRADRSQKEPPNAKHIFAMGSASQIFVASLYQIAVEKGLIIPTNYVNFYLNSNQQFDAGHKITVQHLAQHTSGLPKLPPAFGLIEKDVAQPYLDYDCEKFINDLKSLDSNHLQINQYAHSNLNYALLGLILRQTFKDSTSNETQPYADWAMILKNNLFDAADMLHTGVYVHENDKNLEIAGYNLAQKKVTPAECNCMTPALKAHADMDDLLQFLKIHIGLKNTTLAKTLAPMTVNSVPTKIDKRTSMATGWHLQRENKHTEIAITSGYTNGNAVFMAFVKNTKTGVIVLTNSKNGHHKLGYLILKMMNRQWKR
jgi:CubicO group peptidase (beta-lactamase class C family)